MTIEKSLRILILVDHAVARSGPHRNVVGTLNALTKRTDVDLKILCGEYDRNEPYFGSDNLKIVKDFNPHRVSRVFQNLRAVSRATADRDIIYVPSGLKSFLYAFLCKKGTPLVAGPNVSPIPFIMPDASPTPLMTVHMSDAWIEMSDFQVGRCKNAGTPAERIFLVPHSVDLNLFNPKKRNKSIWTKEGMDPLRTKLIHVGRMNKEAKGIRQIIDAFYYAQMHFDDVDLVFVGKTGEQLRQCDLSGTNIYHLGPRYGTDLAQLVASSDLFVGASRWETFWLAPLEAMASGVPVVVSKVGAIPEMIPENGIQGVVVDIVNHAHQFRGDSAELLGQAIVDLLQNRSQMQQIGTAGRDYIKSRFSEEMLGHRLIHVFNEALKGSQTSNHQMA